MAIIDVIFTVMLLISAGILADNTRSYKASGLCDSWKSVHKDIECNNLVVAVVSYATNVRESGLDDHSFMIHIEIECALCRNINMLRSLKLP